MFEQLQKHHHKQGHGIIVIECCVFPVKIGTGQGASCLFPELAWNAEGELFIFIIFVDQLSSVQSFIIIIYQIYCFY